jgi:Uma2 family endonuclease
MKAHCGRGLCLCPCWIGCCHDHVQAPAGAALIPTPPDVLLLVEVSDSSLAFDQSTKRALYARHGVAEYWMVDMPGRRVDVYCEPTADGYGEAFARAQTDIVSPRALPAVQVTAGTLFA